MIPVPSINISALSVEAGPFFSSCSFTIFHAVLGSLSVALSSSFVGLSLYLRVIYDLSIFLNSAHRNPFLLFLLKAFLSVFTSHNTAWQILSYHTVLI